MQFDKGPRPSTHVSIPGDIVDGLINFETGSDVETRRIKGGERVKDRPREGPGDKV